MNSKTTYVWGVVADATGIVRWTTTKGEALPGCGLRAWREVEHAHEPATAYGSTHPAPMPMRWGHGEEIGRILALRRAHSQLHAVAEIGLINGVPHLVGFRKCVDLAGNRTVPLHAHHEHLHFGASGVSFDGESGHIVIPAAPFPSPFADPAPVGRLRGVRNVPTSCDTGGLGPADDARSLSGRSETT